MTDNVIKYKSAQKAILSGSNALGTMDENGITCQWYAIHHHSPVPGRRRQANQCKTDFTWNFDWTELKEQGIASLSGYLTLNTNLFLKIGRIEIDWKEGKEKVMKTLNVGESGEWGFYVSYELQLTPIYSKKVDHDEMFVASDKTDAVLVVEGKQLHVNKAFLSFHSDFFTALFSSNFKEGEMTEIPIEDVSYEDFALLLSTIYPKQVFPNDATAEKLLELADRFLVPSVTHVVEYHLMEHSKLSNAKSIWLADIFKMPKLLEKSIRSMDTVEKAKALKKSEEYNKISLETIEKLFSRVLEVV